MGIIDIAEERVYCQAFNQYSGISQFITDSCSSCLLRGGCDTFSELRLSMQEQIHAEIRSPLVVLKNGEVICRDRIQDYETK